MLALISPAKTMQGSPAIGESSLRSEPRFMVQTDYIVSQLSHYSAAELSDIFRVSGSIARELKQRFLSFYDPAVAKLPAVYSYDGVVYKHFKDSIAAEYLQSHVRISSLLYGLLRPLDVIQPYRMEGFVRMADSDERVDKYWRDIQTQTLIDDVNVAGGVLLYLASKEEQNAFNWQQVRKQVRVIDFKFYQLKGEKLRQVVVYTKMARGEMIRYMMEHNVTDLESLKSFEWGGYRYNEAQSSADEWVWVVE